MAIGKAVLLLPMVLENRYHLPEGPRSGHVGAQQLGSVAEIKTHVLEQWC